MNQKTKKSFPRLSDPALISAAKIILASMTNNHFFPSPYSEHVAPLDEINRTLVEYEQSFLDSLSGDKQKIAARKTVRQRLIDQLEGLASYVDLVAKGDLRMLSTTGFEIRKEAVSGSAKHTAVQPVLEVKQSPKRGAILAKTKRVPGAKSFEIHLATSDPRVEDNWRHAGVFALCSNMEISGLSPGQQYSFRLRCIMSDGPGPWSNPFSFMPT